MTMTALRILLALCIAAVAVAVAVAATGVGGDDDGVATPTVLTVRVGYHYSSSQCFLTQTWRCDAQLVARCSGTCAVAPNNGYTCTATASSQSLTTTVDDATGSINVKYNPVAGSSLLLHEVGVLGPVRNPPITSLCNSNSTSLTLLPRNPHTERHLQLQWQHYSWRRAHATVQRHWKPHCDRQLVHRGCLGERDGRQGLVSRRCWLSHLHPL